MGCRIENVATGWVLEGGDSMNAARGQSDRRWLHAELPVELVGDIGKDAEVIHVLGIDGEVHRVVIDRSRHWCGWIASTASTAA
jgi:hypothetical protein